MQKTLIYNNNAQTPEGIDRIFRHPVVASDSIDDFQQYFWSVMPGGEVETGKHKHGQGILFSENYKENCGLALIGNKIIALSNKGMETETIIRAYVYEMLDAVLQQTNRHEVVAVPFGGLPIHFGTIQDILYRENISIANHFIDQNTTSFLTKPKCTDKSVKVNSITQTIIMEAEFEGMGKHYIKLYDGTSR